VFSFVGYCAQDLQEIDFTNIDDMRSHILSALQVCGLGHLMDGDATQSIKGGVDQIDGTPCRYLQKQDDAAEEKLLAFVGLSSRMAGAFAAQRATLSFGGEKFDKIRQSTEASRRIVKRYLDEYIEIAKKHKESDKVEKARAMGLFATRVVMDFHDDRLKIGRLDKEINAARMPLDYCEIEADNIITSLDDRMKVCELSQKMSLEELKKWQQDLAESLA